MKKQIESNIRDLYIVFSKGFFVPDIIEKSGFYAEPFNSAIQDFKKWVSTNEKNLSAQLSISSSWTPFWNKHIFIPNIGKLTFNHKKNITSRLLVGYNKKNRLGSPYTFCSSREFTEIPHLPFLVTFNKKIGIKPLPSKYLQSTKNKESHPVHQQIKIYIHLYPYGLCFIHIAVSMTSNQSLQPENIINWLQSLKSPGGKLDKQTEFIVSDKFKGSLDDLFEFLWEQIAKKVFSKSNYRVISSPVYDSIRLKGVSRISEDDLKNKTNDKINPKIHAYFKQFRKLQTARKNRTLLGYKYSKLSLDIKRHILLFVRRKKEISLTSEEIAGLLTKDVNWRQRKIAPNEYSSVFGKYQGDTIIQKPQSTLIVSNIWSHRKQLFLLFQWQLIAVNEIAIAQKMIYPYLIDTLNSIAMPDGNSDFDKKKEFSLLSFAHGLTNISNHLPPHMRKWYYIVSSAYNVPRRQKELTRLLDIIVNKNIHVNNEQPRTLIDLKQAIIHQLQIGDNNTAQIYSKEKEDE